MLLCGAAVDAVLHVTATNQHVLTELQNKRLPVAFQGVYITIADTSEISEHKISPAGVKVAILSVLAAHNSGWANFVSPVEVLCKHSVGLYCSHNLLSSALCLRQVLQAQNRQCTGCQLMALAAALAAR